MHWMTDALRRARKSTLKRLEDLSEPQLDWADVRGHTIRDIAWHIGDADLWLAHKLGRDGEVTDGRLVPGLALGKRQAQLFVHLRDALACKLACVERHLDQLEAPITHSSYGTITVGEFILCTGLDHESHHRGQIAFIRTQHRGER